MAKAQQFNVRSFLKDADLSTVSGLKIFFYITGTTTDKTAWSDAAETTPLVQPYTVTDGDDDVFLDGVYRIRVRNSADTITLAEKDDMVFFRDTFADAITFSAGLTLAGDFTVDSPTFHVDSTNNVVGVGTITPNSSSVLDIEVNGNIGVSLSVGGTPKGAMTVIDSSNELSFQSVNDIIFQTGNVDEDTATERARLGTNGRLGVGTASAATKLHLVESSGDTIATLEVVEATKSSIINFADSGSQTIGQIKYQHADDSMRLFTNGASQLHIDSGGVVSLGTATPTRAASLFNVEQTSATAYTAVDLSDNPTTHIRNTNTDSNRYVSIGFRVGSSDGGIGFVEPSGASNEADFVVASANGQEILRVKDNGNMGLGTTNPDALLELEGAAIQLHLDSSSTAEILIDAAVGDPILTYALAGVDKFTIGIDDTDSDKLKIAASGSPETNTAIEITSGQAVTMKSTLAVDSTSTFTGATTHNGVLNLNANLDLSGDGDIAGSATFLADVTIDNQPRAQIFRNSSQTISTGVATAIQFDAENFDFGSMHSNSSNNTRLTISDAGTYLISGVVEFDNNATGTRSVSIRQDGSVTLASFRENGPDASSNELVNFSLIFRFVGTEYVEIVANQNSGGNLDLLGANINQTNVQICKLC